MSRQINAGNFLPFYENVQHQRHRQVGTDTVPYGMIAPRTRLLPFQIRINEAYGGGHFLYLINAQDDLTQITLDPAQVEINEAADGLSFWATFYANEEIDNIPECGYWYIKFEHVLVGRYSEVLYLKDFCGHDAAELTISDCSTSGSDILIELTPVIYSRPGYSLIIERLGLGWSTISAGEDPYTQTENLASGTAQYGIVVTTDCGLIITKRYTATWTDCNDLTLTLNTQEENAANIGNNPTWRLVFSSEDDQDKGNVLYQTGYVQHMYLELPVWDVPVMNRVAESAIDGYGNITRRFSRTVTQQIFESADVPDWAISFLVQAQDMVVQMENVETGDIFTLSNFLFESRRQGASLNIGRFLFDENTEIFNNCENQFSLL